MREVNAPTRPRTRRVEVIRSGVHLLGMVSIPVGEPPYPCVIFVHGLGSSKESPRNVVIAERLLDAGLATLLFDLSGHGESTPDPRDGDEAYIRDLLAFFRWAVHRPELELLGVAGSSLGAVVAVEAARRGLIRPTTMVLRAPPVERERLADLPVPSLAVVGSRDPLLQGVREAAEMSRALAVHVVEGAGHLFEEPGTLEDATEKTVGWFKGRLIR
jgi:pimeloyl-ACP methyl ester carboxylesterase